MQKVCPGWGFVHAEQIPIHRDLLFQDAGRQRGWKTFTRRIADSGAHSSTLVNSERLGFFCATVVCYAEL